MNIDDNILVDYHHIEQFTNDLSFALEKSYKIYNKKVKKKNREYSKKFNVRENYNQIVDILK